MRKMESEVEESQGPGQGAMMCIDGHNPIEEAKMILEHGNMGPSQGEMDKDMSMDDSMMKDGG